MAGKDRVNVDREKEIAEVLRAQGYRLTPQRLAVVHMLAATGLHPSAEQIYAAVRSSFPTTSLATVYKVIEVLKSVGQLHELGYSDGRNRYDATQAHLHPHLICIRCKAVIDVEIPGFETLPAQVVDAHGYQVTHHRLEFFGICPKCGEEKYEPSAFGG